MRRFTIVLAAGLMVLGLASISRSQNPATQSDPQKENEALRADNQRLRQRLEDLNKSLDQNARSLDQLQKALKAPSTRRTNIPKDWIKKDFNGQPLYIIPCK